MSKNQALLRVISDLRSLAGSLEILLGTLETGEPAAAAAAVPAEQAPAKAAPADSTAAELERPALEEVRAAMAEKSREGRREAVKAIIYKYGASKLTAIAPKHYAAVLREVQAIK
ncbi:hypothetical protein SPSYN_00024 [Sporotomaculum syntrophicum]|uniref:rRNA biogenesis protein rrp5 n=1 Tax=Sporotomaculum syntrophicum TaxID=182264 RepID=A0A9D3AYQ0_9FIRM|nr:rRNA biogenesis protein rrp5 [Sporotomaculum syntrophicum]KAF1086307.1 hypothetical protein SPSYN_00024 [Sporotomaculum syntrophicum]